MIKLLVVDDEVFVRVGLASAVAWKDHGFELVGGAEDGASALEQCRRLRPDIALVDIKMNGMDGLDFIERARQEFPGMRFIVLSCHNDFEYMQRAIRLGVRDYIVKNTVQPRELVEAVTKVAQGLHPGDKALGESKPDPLLSLFEGDSAVFDECALRIPFFAVAVEAVDREAFLRKYKGEALERMLDGAAKLAGEVISMDFRFCLARAGECGFAAAVCAKYGGETGAQEIERLFLRVAGVLKKYLGVEMAAGIGGAAGAANEASRSWAEAQLALKLRFYHKDSGVIAYPGSCAADDALARAMEAKQRALELAHTGKLGEAAGVMADMIRGGPVAALDPQKLMMLCAGAAEEIFLRLHRAGIIGEEEMAVQLRQLIDRILASVEQDGLARAMEDAMCTAADHYESARSANREAVQAICRYIDRNIGGALSLTHLSGIAQISAGHLSRVFKQETGENLKDYLQRKRMDYARELALNGLSFEEIASRCGFEDASSFSRAFRRSTGEAFRDYRRRLHQKGQTQSK